MKRKILFLVLAGFSILLTAQMPQNMSYQAVVRNVSNQLAVNQQVRMRISILQGSATGVPVFVETHATTTNSNGLVTIEIGGGTPVSGTIAGINWSSGPYFLKTETDPSGGTNYTITGTSQLLSVPYAFHAKSAENGFSGAWSDITGKPSTLAGYGITDADASNTNEIQSLSINGSQLTLSNGGGTVAIPSSADNWGNQVAITDATLSGNGTSANTLRIAQQSATTGQVLKWNGTTWNPSQDLTGEFTLPYTGTTNAQNGITVVNSSTLESAIAIAGSVSTTSENGGSGVAGSSNSSNGNGVTGIANASTGPANGVLGISRSGNGRGVYGLADSYGGTNYGVYGSSNSEEGYGVYGVSPTFGVSGEAIGEDGMGVTGRAVYTHGTGVSGTGEYIGIKGEATSFEGDAYGVYGYSRSPLGYAVYGQGNYNGVKGIASNTTGKVYGVYGWSLSPEGYSGYFTGGSFYVDGNVGIGNISPTCKLDVTGNRIRLIQGTNWIAMRTDGTPGMVDLSYNGKLVVQGTATTDDIILNPALASKVGIRTWVPMYDLDVTGNIRATGSVFYGGTPANANGNAYSKPDYVFEKDYEAISTSDIAEYLRTEKHLPWITSAVQEKKENGDVTDMTRMAFETVETVENLQLQIIQMDKQIKLLTDMVISLQQKIESIERQE